MVTPLSLSTRRVHVRRRRYNLFHRLCESRIRKYLLVQWLASEKAGNSGWTAFVKSPSQLAPRYQFASG
eukprot:6187428-Pleurochrysis_carterae.AAC.1